MTRTALISDCGLYRYFLTRQWVDFSPRLYFVMLNPSTADADVDDPTIRKCMTIARNHNFGGIHVLNVFAYRSTDPKHLLKLLDPVGPLNDGALTSIPMDATVVCAWGKHPRIPNQLPRLRVLLAGITLRCLKRNQDGSPKHPLYTPNNSALLPYEI